MCDNAPLQKFADKVSPANLSMTARTASKSCARSWSRDEHILDLDLMSSLFLKNKNLDLYVPRTPTAQLICLILYLRRLSSSSQFYLSVCHMCAWMSMLNFSSFSLFLFSSIYCAKNIRIFSCSRRILSARFSSSCLYLISFSLLYFASISSSNRCLSAIFWSTLSAILFIKS